MTKSFGAEPTPPREREQVWVARLETAGSLASTTAEEDDLSPLFTQATRSLPFSTKLWDLLASFTEASPSLTPAAVEAWYTSSIRRVLLTDALPPAGFLSSFSPIGSSEEDYLPPRDLLPRRFVHYLATVSPAAFEPKLLALLASCPSLSLDFLSSVLDPSSPALVLGSGKTDLVFRSTIHDKITAHPDAGAEEWVAYAEELFRAGNGAGGGVAKAQEVLRRARGQLRLKGEAEVQRFDALWEVVCARMEQ